MAVESDQQRASGKLDYRLRVNVVVHGLLPLDDRRLGTQDHDECGCCFWPLKQPYAAGLEKGNILYSIRSAELSSKSPWLPLTTPPQVSTTMSLEDLTQYADDQEDRINHCKSDIAPGPDSLLWTGLWKSVWGKGLRSLEKEELVERDEPSHRIEDPCTNPDAIPPSTSVIEIPSTLPDLWARSSKRILARSEYYEAEQTALSASEIYRDALVIAGHPGIGTLSSCRITCRI